MNREPACGSQGERCTGQPRSAATKLLVPASADVPAGQRLVTVPAVRQTKAFGINTANFNKLGYI